MTTRHPLIQGSLVALATPMTIDNQIDWDALTGLVQYHLDKGTHGIVAVGTSGESATLSVGEHLKVIDAVVKQVNGRIPVIAGTGSNSTMEAVELTQKAADLGADACLIVVPYYNKPTQEGLFRHFSYIADAVNIPQILYNVPGRTITDLSNETALRLAPHKNIIGIKDAVGDPDRSEELINAAPEGFVVYSGDDITAYELMLRGGKGNISVTANIAAGLMSELCELCLKGEREAAEALQAKLMPLHESLFTEANPIPVKWALSHLGLAPEGIRLPLTPLSDSCKPAIVDALAAVGLGQ